jgi:hypothetical protein
VAVQLGQSSLGRDTPGFIVLGHYHGVLEGQTGVDDKIGSNFSVT